MEIKNNKRLFCQLIFLTALLIGSVLIIKKQPNIPYQNSKGMIFGTVYNITYQSTHDLNSGIKATMNRIDSSLSFFNKQSILSRINRNESIEPDNIFHNVFCIARDISKKTNGAFDITVAPLVNAWGFGFESGTIPTPQQVDSLLKITGYKKVNYKNIGGRKTIVKDDSRITLDCGAIAKGYGVDAVADYLASQGVENYMVEIGGEVITKGISPKRLPWKIGISKPVDDSLNTNKELQTILNVTNMAMATSGNYRNFYYKDGRKYAHTIDPETGYPVQHSLLSATVLAKRCATADAFATAFMVMGIDKAKKILDDNHEIMAYLIYADKNGKLKVWYSPLLKDIITE